MDRQAVCDAEAAVAMSDKWTDELLNRVFSQPTQDGLGI